MSMRLGLCLLLIVSFFPLTASAQTDLVSLRESWGKCSKQMAESLEALNAGDTTPGLADDYRDLVDEANRLIKSMRQQAVVELQEDPGNGETIRTLLGIMVHDAQESRDAEVLKAGDALIKARINPMYFEQATKIERLELSQKWVFEELLLRHAEAIADDLPRVKLETSAGDIVLELYENEAPNTVRNFVSMVESGFYTNKLFHRVIEDFMAQGGGFETEGIGSGGPGYQIECECREPNARRNFSNTISMAHAGRDTGGSQFFLNFKHNEGLDRVHTVFGRVIEGAPVLELIERTDLTVNGREREIAQSKPDKIIAATVLRKRDHSYRVRKKGEPELPEEPVKEEPAEQEEPAAEGEEEKEEPDSEAAEDAAEMESAEDGDDPQTEPEESATDPEPADKAAKSDASDEQPAEAETEEAEAPAEPEPTEPEPTEPAAEPAEPAPTEPTEPAAEDVGTPADDQDS